MSRDTTHLHALELRLSHERERLRCARSGPERDLRAVWVAQIEREIADERRFLGIADTPNPGETMNDADLLAALTA